MPTAIEKAIATGKVRVGPAGRMGEKWQINIKQTIDGALQARYDQLGDVKGQLGKLVRKDELVWYFESGCLCFNHGRVFEIHGDIYKKWDELGGMSWGKPDTDESPCADGRGRYNHFANDSKTIMWLPEIGAKAVYGDIRTRWTEIGWERSYLGYPTSDETDFPDGGRVSAFQHGGIYWWPDTGAIDINDVVVHYTGLVCIKETGEISGADEPYTVMGVVSPFGSGAFQSKIYESVDSNTSRPDLLEIYRGKPNGLAIAVRLMENDHGDPAKITRDIADAMTQAHKLGTQALGVIPVVGPGIAAVVGPLIQSFIPDIAKAVTAVFGFGDDEIGRQIIVLTGKDLLVMARRTQNSTYKGVGFKFSTNNLRGENANYKVYFGIVPV